MHPAFSVIFFTVFSGAGYGLLALMGTFVALGMLPMTQALGIAGLGLGTAAVTAGLLSSTWHLGHPQRAWRAFSQWRSSWLSREGVVSVLTFVPIAMLAYGWLGAGEESGRLTLWGSGTALGAVATVACTGMIYRNLKTIHQWHNTWTVPCYLSLGLASGAVWLQAVLSVLGLPVVVVGVTAIALLALAWWVKTRYWRHIDTTAQGSTLESATGLGRHGTVRYFEGPHTEDNYLLKEMGYRVARKHAAKLRRYGVGLSFIAPVALVLLSLVTPGAFAALMAALAALSVTAGLLIERWLFFAEARHVVTLYYGRGD